MHTHQKIINVSMGSCNDQCTVLCKNTLAGWSTETLFFDDKSNFSLKAS